MREDWGGGERSYLYPAFVQVDHKKDRLSPSQLFFKVWEFESSKIWRLYFSIVFDFHVFFLGGGWVGLGGGLLSTLWNEKCKKLVEHYDLGSRAGAL